LRMTRWLMADLQNCSWIIRQNHRASRWGNTGTRKLGKTKSGLIAPTL